MKTIDFLAVLLITLLTFTESGATDYSVIVLAGQSNMEGYGTAADVPATVSNAVDSVPIFHGNAAADEQPTKQEGTWLKLKPGHGSGFWCVKESVGYSKQFGVEMTFAQRLKTLWPNRNIALIKYARGGSSIHQDAASQFGCWEPNFEKGNGEGKGINQYDHYMATLRAAMSFEDIDGDGHADSLTPIGIIWMQGESDAASGPHIAVQYESNLKRLMDLMRASLRYDDLPVVIGRISDSGQDASDGKVWDHGQEVRDAQEAFTQNDPSAALVTSTDQYSFSDKWHYDTEGYLDLGEQFADALDKLIK